MPTSCKLQLPNQYALSFYLTEKMQTLYCETFLNYLYPYILI